MKFTWLQRNSSPRLLLFFNGWAQDDTLIRHLQTDANVLTISDYRELGDLPDVSAYEHIDVVAWSMGVWAAANSLRNVEVNSATAVCGSEMPVNEHFGIAPRIFDITLSGMRKNGVGRFYDRMFHPKTERSRFPEIITCRDEVEQIDELELIGSQAHTRKSTINWTKAVVCQNDKIFVAENLTNYWRSRNVPTVTLDAGHCPFARFEKWSQLIDIQAV